MSHSTIRFPVGLDQQFYADLLWLPPVATATITGTSGNDELVGTPGDDTINGLEGDDLLTGGGGNNVLNGGIGSDYAVYVSAPAGVAASLTTNIALLNGYGGIDSFSGVENLIGSEFGDDLTGLASAASNLQGYGGNDILRGGSAGDTLIGGSGTNTLIGGGGDDSYFVSSASDVIVEAGGAGTDTVFTIGVDFTLADNVENGTITGTGNFGLTGNAGANLLIGNSGNNALDGGGGGDTLNGGAGDDTYTIDSVGDVIVDSAGIDTVRTTLLSYTPGSGLENLTFIGAGTFTGTGNASSNIFTGGVGRDVFFGEGGDDRFIGSAGNNLYSGGSGVDTADYSLAPAGVTLSLTMGTASNGFGGTDSIDTMENVIGSAFADTIRGSGADNRLEGGDGNDFLYGLGGSDVLVGGAGNDFLDGGEFAGGVIDTLMGGTGDDTYAFVSGNLLVENPGEGIDTVIGSNVSLADNFENATGTGTLTGNSANNVLTSQGGAGGTVTLIGRGGANTYIGAASTDVASYAGAPAGVHVDLNDGVATANGYGAADTLTNIEDLIGSDFNDVLVGNGARNVLVGGLGYDTLAGLAGDDTLFGGTGSSNELIGGEGNDTYFSTAIGDTIVELPGGGTDAVVTTLASFTLANNVENLIFNGTGSFSGTGNALDNQISGGSGDDRLAGLAGNNTLNGGGGIDVADYSAATLAISIALGDPGPRANGFGGFDQLISIEGVIGGSGDDVLVGTQADNVLSGGEGRDTLVGLGGNDTISGGTGVANELYGGTGDDTFIVGAIGDTIVENFGEGTDTVQTRLNYFVMAPNVENFVFTGDAAVTAFGNDTNNSFTGKSGNDTFYGEAGNDVLLLAGLEADYSVTSISGGFRITDTKPGVDGDDGTDTVYGVERVRYRDGTERTLSAAGSDVIAGDAAAIGASGGADAPAELLAAVAAADAAAPLIDQAVSRFGLSPAFAIDFGGPAIMSIAPPLDSLAASPAIVPGG